MIPVTPLTAPGRGVASSLKPEAQRFMIKRLRKVLSILEQIQIDCEANTVATALVAESLTLLRATVTIAKRDLITQLDSLVDQGGDSPGK
jgi:hypothetical protein